MYLKETSLSFYPVARGSSVRSDVIKIQDWLRLNGAQIASDGEFGPGTEAAVKEYQNKINLIGTGIVDLNTWMSLVKPLVTAMSFRPTSSVFGEAVVEIARAHCALHPTELDANRDGWVRTYCQGPDGEAYSWCQGFASTIHEQACAPNVAPPIDLYIYDAKTDRKLWCLFVPTMANQAKLQKRFVSSEQAQNNPKLVTPGSMFFLKGGQYGYLHVGIVTGPIFNGHIPTIEGNTNSNGSSNGFEVCTRVRNVSSCDYGVV